MPILDSLLKSEQSMQSFVTPEASSSFEAANNDEAGWLAAWSELALRLLLIYPHDSFLFSNPL
jgi:hypothetical protein